MKAIILAAGRGSRMMDLTDNRPKCLVEIHDKPLLEWQLAALREAGIEQVAIVTGYRREMIAERADMEFHNPLWAKTNMVSSLAESASWLESGPCIVSYSDIFYEASAVVSLIKSEAPLALSYDPDWLRLWSDRFGDPLDDAETFRIAKDDRLTEIGNTPTSIDQVEGQYMGLLRFTPEGWGEVRSVREELPQDKRDDLHMTGALQLVIKRNKIPITAIPYRGVWGEVDSKSDLQLYNDQEWI